MPYDPATHHRRSVRLKGHDYTQPGAYFVTIVTHNRECVFGEIVNDQVRLNEWGEMAAACWRDLPRHFEFVTLDTWVVMPNHLHAILNIVEAKHSQKAGNPSPLPPRGTQPGSLGALIQNYKAITTRKIRQSCRAPDIFRFAWQRNYFEHVIRDNPDLGRIRRYIAANPVQWALDTENPIPPKP